MPRELRELCLHRSRRELRMPRELRELRLHPSRRELRMPRELRELRLHPSRRELRMPRELRELCLHRSRRELRMPRELRELRLHPSLKKASGGLVSHPALASRTCPSCRCSLSRPRASLSSGDVNLMKMKIHRPSCWNRSSREKLPNALCAILRELRPPRLCLELRPPRLCLELLPRLC